MQTPGLILSLTAAGLVIWLVIVFLYRRLYGRFPYFFLYLVAATIMTAARLAFKDDYLTFFKVFWATEAVYALLALLAVHEVFRRVFALFYLFWWFWLVFPSAVVVIVFITFANAAHTLAQAPQLVKLVVAVGMTAKYVEAGLFVVFVLLASLLGVTWRSYAFGIVQGFALSALGAWFAYGVRSEFGNKFTTFATYSPAVAYILTVVLWLATFLRDESPAAEQRWILAVTPDELLAEIKRHTVLLRRFFNKRDGT